MRCCLQRGLWNPLDSRGKGEAFPEASARHLRTLAWTLTKECSQLLNRPGPPFFKPCIPPSGVHPAPP